MNEYPTGKIPAGWIQTGPNEWTAPSRLGRLQTQVPEPISRPLVGARPRKDARAKPVAGSRGAKFRIALIAFRHRILDDDNNVGACKQMRDAIAEWLGMSDSQKNIQWTYSQCQTSGREGLIVKIEPTGATSP